MVTWHHGWNKDVMTYKTFLYRQLLRYRQLLTSLFIFSLTAGISLSIPQTLANPDCEDIRRIEQSGREFANTGLGYQELKQNLIDALLKQSVEQVLGKQITANERAELSVHNDELEESLRTLTVERAKGFVTGYELLPPGDVHMV